eukprot:g58454.t1
MSKTGCDPLWPQHSQCGHGYCGPDGTCVCDKGWTGNGDMITTDNCHLNLLLIRVLWILPAIIISIMLYRFYWNFFFQLEIFRNKQAQSRKPIPPGIRGVLFKMRAIWMTDALRCTFFFGTAAASYIFFCVAKIMFPARQISRDIIFNLSFNIAAFQFYNTVISNIWMYLVISMKAARLPLSKLEKILKKLKMLTVVLTVINALIMALPWITWIYPEYQWEVARAYYVGKGFFVVVNVSTEAWTNFAVTRQLEEAASMVPSNQDDTRRQKLISSMKQHARTAMKSGLIAFVIWLVVGLWPYVTSCDCLVLPLILLLAAKTGIGFLEFLPKGEKKNRKQSTTSVTEGSSAMNAVTSNKTANSSKRLITNQRETSSQAHIAVGASPIQTTISMASQAKSEIDTSPGPEEDEKVNTLANESEKPQDLPEKPEELQELEQKDLESDTKHGLGTLKIPNRDSDEVEGRMVRLYTWDGEEPATFEFKEERKNTNKPLNQNRPTTSPGIFSLPFRKGKGLARPATVVPQLARPHSSPSMDRPNSSPPSMDSNHDAPQKKSSKQKYGQYAIKAGEPIEPADRPLTTTPGIRATENDEEESESIMRVDDDDDNDDVALASPILPDPPTRHDHHEIEATSPYYVSRNLPTDDNHRQDLGHHHELPDVNPDYGPRKPSGVLHDLQDNSEPRDLDHNIDAPNPDAESTLRLEEGNEHRTDHQKDLMHE